MENNENVVKTEKPHWNKVKFISNEFECSECKSTVAIDADVIECDYRFCPYCGVKMEG